MLATLKRLTGMGTRAAVAGHEEQRPPTIPDRIHAEPQMSDTDRCDYVEKAKALGVFNGALKQEMLLALFKENGITVYPLEKVTAYLDSVFGVAQGYHLPAWGWRPLREQDRGKLRSQHNSYNGQIMGGTYQQAVPMPVLLTVEKISVAVPDVHFFVSDRPTSQDGDPFLAVSAVGMDMLVIERWDEPSFRA